MPRKLAAPSPPVSTIWGRANWHSSALCAGWPSSSQTCPPCSLLVSVSKSTSWFGAKPMRPGGA
eukprot:2054046-Lingulodinium_polyedra.AAC.1